MSKSASVLDTQTTLLTPSVHTLTEKLIALVAKITTTKPEKNRKWQFHLNLGAKDEAWLKVSRTHGDLVEMATALEASLTVIKEQTEEIANLRQQLVGALSAQDHWLSIVSERERTSAMYVASVPVAENTQQKCRLGDSVSRVRYEWRESKPDSRSRERRS